MGLYKKCGSVVVNNKKKTLYEKGSKKYVVHMKKYVELSKYKMMKSKKAKKGGEESMPPLGGGFKKRGGYEEQEMNTSTDEPIDNEYVETTPEYYQSPENPEFTTGGAKKVKKAKASKVVKKTKASKVVKKPKTPKDKKNDSIIGKIFGFMVATKCVGKKCSEKKYVLKK